MRSASILLSVSLLCGNAAAQADEGKREARAMETIDAVLDGEGVAASRHFNEVLRAALPAGRISGIVEALRQQLGDPKDRGPWRHGCEGRANTLWQRIAFEQAPLDAKVTFDAEDRIAGLFFVPPQHASPCSAGSVASDAGSAPVEDERERSVSVGAVGWPLPGILTRPDGDGPFPVVVMVHGSGPHDADETIFSNKPFRDLAHGLADLGVASLRYVKRSKEHAGRMLAETPDFGIDDEVTDDAVSAMAWVSIQAQIDPARIFVLGHSLGAMMAPRICRRSEHCTGMILLAAPARRIEDLVVEQIRYLAPSQGIDNDRIVAIEEQAERVRRLGDGEKVDGPLLLGLGASYWRSLAGYEPVAAAREAARPALVLQGERDYQVTLEDFAAWRELAGVDADIHVKSYAALDHLFMPGKGPSLPADYMQPRRVDAQVINDIASWIDKQPATTRDRNEP